MRYRTIFHIDDDDDDIDFFAEAVNQLSDAVRCISFTNALEALQKLMAGDMVPDIIFLDLNMPVMNGQQFLSRLRESGKLNTIPVIILSTASDANIQTQLKSGGASDFLTKPSSLKELTALLRPFIS